MRLVVLIPAFNARQNLERTLASLAHDPVLFDVVIVDDGSVPPLAVPNAVGSHQIFLLRLPQNRGIACALNTGVRWILAQGYDAIARLDAGDMNMPQRFAKQLAFLERQPSVALVGGWTRHLDEEFEPLYVTRYPKAWDEILRRLHYRTAFSHGACMLRVSALRDVGVYSEEWPLGEDYELFWRLALRYECANLPEVLVTRVECCRSLTHANRFAMARSRLRLQRRHFVWHRLDCWLGLARSVSLLAVPAGVKLTVKRAVGTVG